MTLSDATHPRMQNIPMLRTPHWQQLYCALGTIPTSVRLHVPATARLIVPLMHGAGMVLMYDRLAYRYVSW